MACKNYLNRLHLSAKKDKKGENISVWTAVWSGVLYFYHLFAYWLSVFFVIPLKDLEVLWILIPIWINFIFTEFFQEREGTSMGNAVTNGAIMLWVGIDWIRFLVRNYKGFGGLLGLKVFLCVLCIIGGFMIIYEGIRGKAVIRRIARVREVTYVMLVLSPLIYGLIDPNLQYLLSIIIFAPLFYFFFEFLDFKLPGAGTYKEKYET